MFGCRKQTFIQAMKKEDIGRNEKQGRETGRSCGTTTGEAKEAFASFRRTRETSEKEKERPADGEEKLRRDAGKP